MIPVREFIFHRPLTTEKQKAEETAFSLCFMLLNTIGQLRPFQNNVPDIVQHSVCNLPSVWLIPGNDAIINRRKP